MSPSVAPLLSALSAVDVYIAEHDPKVILTEAKAIGFERIWVRVTGTRRGYIRVYMVNLAVPDVPRVFVMFQSFASDDYLIEEALHFNS
jgi:hypothetical protein